jgi:hypothetical protein
MLVSAAGGQATSTWLGLTALGAGKAERAAKIWHLPDAAAAGLRRVWYLMAIAPVAAQTRPSACLAAPDAGCGSARHR